MRPGLFTALLPAEAVVVEEHGAPRDGGLYPEELPAVHGAVSSRRREFAATRRCARRALGQLGIPAGPIPKRADGAPAWPEGVIGSLTHCAGFRAACVMRARHGVATAVGIDAEPHRPLPEETWPLVIAEDERPALTGLPAGVEAELAIFCAKEACIKAWWSSARRPVGFADLAVTLTPDGSFSARLRPGADRATAADALHPTGRWHVAAGLLVAGVVLCP